MLHQSKCEMRPRMPVTIHVKALSELEEPNLNISSYPKKELVLMNPEPKKKRTKKTSSKKNRSKKTGSKNKSSKKKKMSGGAVRDGSTQNFVQK